LFGGVIAARYGLGDTPGISSLTAESRRGLDDEAVWRHIQHLPGGVPVLVGPATADEAQVVLRDLSSALSAWSTDQTEIDLIIDLGRIPPNSSTIDVIGVESVTMVLVRPTLDQLRPAAHRVAGFNTSGVDSGLLLVGDEPYGPGEVTAALTTPVVGVVAWDPRSAAVLSGAHGAVRDLRRSPLVRSVATLAERFAPPLLPEPEPVVDTEPAPVAQTSERSQEVRS
jgi:hypothetical protein